MLKSYLLIAWRNLARNKFYTLINIIGLAVGIACFTLILLYVQGELSYDKFNSKQDRIWRICENIDNTEGQGEKSSSLPFPVGPNIRNEYSHLVEHIVRFFNFQDPSHTLKAGDNKLFNETKLYVADSTLFDVFDYHLLKGDPKTALAAPGTIVLSQMLAKKYFGKDDPMGKILKFDGTYDLKVTGVFDSLPQNTHLHFDGLISFPSIRQIFGPNFENQNWVWNPCWTYALLKPNVKPDDLNKQFPDFVQRRFPELLKKQVKLYLQPLSSIHLDSKLSYEAEPNGDRSTVYILGCIGLFILIIACINFMNLATARSANRAREVGVRKVAGAGRGLLIRQFMIESLILSFIATLLSLVLIELLLPVFNSIAGNEMRLNLQANPELALMLVGIWFLAGVLSGIYPAFFLSSFDPVRVLKANSAGSTRNQALRKGLVIAQFSISLGLIIATGVIYGQMKFLRSADTGFKRSDMIVVDTRPPMFNVFLPWMEEIKQNPDIEGVTAMDDMLGKKHNTHEFNYDGMQPGKWIYFPALIVNEDFVKTFGMKLIAGRSFSKDFPRDDSLSVVINEAMVHHLGWGTPEKALGKRFNSIRGGGERVIGVVKDFNFVSLEHPVGPFVLDMPAPQGRPFWYRHIVIRCKHGKADEVLSYLRKTWTARTAEYPFDYFFLDESLQQQYKPQDNLSKLVAYFAALAVFIACLGLFALASFTAEQRTREIGIRKVLGASTGIITQLLSIDFLRLVIIAALIAWPITWYVLHLWLNGFAYHISPFQPFEYLVASLATLLIALLTVIAQSMRAARANPIKALRHE